MVKSAIGRRRWGSLTAIVFAVLPLGAFLACEDDQTAACVVDTDCPPGNICRERRCGPLSGDAAPPPVLDATTPVCASDGVTCNVNDDCCSRMCNQTRCSSTPPAPTCRSLYELCQGDCCAGLTCVNGACR